MNLEEIREYCLSKLMTDEAMPFDDETIVFRVGGKIFAMLALEKSAINLKCDPDKAVELRERYQDIVPGYHCNKKHWNTVFLERDLSKNLIKEMVDHSYDLVYKSLPKNKKEL